MGHPRGLQIHCLWELSADLWIYIRHIKYKRGSIALLSSLVKPCLRIYSICSVFPTLFHLSYFQILLPICLFFQAKKVIILKTDTNAVICPHTALKHPTILVKPLGLHSPLSLCMAPESFSKQYHQSTAHLMP